MLVRASVVLLLLVAHLAPAHAAVTVYLDRHGEAAHRIPAFGGGDRAWHQVVACVRDRYEPFAVDIVDERPRSGHFITAVIGGRASQLGLDDRKINGVSPFTGHIERDAVVHIFSQVGTGEHDIENLCAVTAHEVGHALGLEHEIYCGDVMSYYDAQCGARTFVDASAPCGEGRARRCQSGARTQDSFRRLGQLVGFRQGAPEREREPEDPYVASNDVRPEPPSPPRYVPRYMPRYVIVRRVVRWRRVYIRP